MWQGIFFPEKSIVEVTGSMYFGNIFGLYVSQSMYKNLKEIVIIQIKSELTIFVNLQFLKNKEFEIIKLLVQFFV